MKHICEYCQTEIIENDGQRFPERKPISGGNVFLDRYLWLHNDCQKERYSNLTIGYSYLDEFLNDCKFFVRENNTMYGYYERNGLKYPEKLWAGLDGHHIQNTEFQSWLKQNGFYPNRWEHRKPEIYQDSVLKSRKKS